MGLRLTSRRLARVRGVDGRIQYSGVVLGEIA
jgi:hypothetical protein